MLYDVVCAVLRFLFIFAFRIKVSGRELVPNDGGFILAVNHRSNFDPVMSALYCPRHLRFMSKEELFKNPIFGGLIKKLGAFPVSRGKGDVSAIKGAFSILKSGEVLLMFPQGHRMKSGQRGKAQTGVSMISHKMRVPVVPMCISGEYKFMRKINIHFGKPIEFSEYYGQKIDGEKQRELAEQVLDKIFELEVK